MADFNSSFFTLGTYDAGTGIFTATADSVAGVNDTTDNEPVGGGQPGDTTFEVGDNLTITGANGGGGQYIGHTGDGFVAQQGGNFFFYSNSAVTQNDELPIDTGDFAVCFAAGTLIATPDGERAVETLKIGDLVMTAEGRTVPVKWLGRQTLSTMFGFPEGRRPVCVSAGALGERLPVRDLRVTATHALLIDGVLVHAGALVNGTTVRRIPKNELGERFVVYHIETENHDIVLAQGAPAETFIDNVTRERFDNYAEYQALYGLAPVAMEELQQPRAMSYRQVPVAIRSRIATAAAALAPAREEVG
ncbi:Hint domain-containing protein [Mesorhizobium sp. LHD-90]|uniref:Hint domain-containing protein n=1 Tax=Mesorhizobium sp. LHD-90 TaxID=3071414 RepID=UPI0027DF97CC|nr:Hint domain-containing protein [Mesorhizobium sp. LHD-90]MDQ6436600.1 Hint domain-containing protein [Mesorhizobium sp. LHD-90]